MRGDTQGGPGDDAAAKVVVAPITDADVDDVAAFLHAEMNQRVAPESWVRAMRSPWQRGAPNHGFHLRRGGEVVGAYLALYSERDIRGSRERFCNLAAWCVREEYRFKGLRLLNALVGQPGYHFVDLSPSGNVIALNERMGFQHLDTGTALVVNLPWPTLPGRGRVLTRPPAIERSLTGRALEVYRDHAGAPAARHVVLRRGDRSCLVVYRRVRRKDLPLFAAVLHVSDPDLFRSMARYFTRHLLVCHAIPFTLVERRIAGSEPWPSRRLASPRPKMFRSDRLTADDIDDLYSELVAVAW